MKGMDFSPSKGKLIREQPPLEENKEYASYDFESLFTNVPIHDTIKYILEEIYTHNKLPYICSKLRDCC